MIYNDIYNDNETNKILNLNQNFSKQYKNVKYVTKSNKLVLSNLKSPAEAIRSMFKCVNGFVQSH